MSKRFLVPGWVPDLPDQRDFKYSVDLAKTTTLVPHVDLRGAFMPSVYDQGDLGSCTANAIAGAVEFEQRKQKLRDFMPSRLFIYYCERALEGTISSDSGAMIRDGFKVLNSQGVCEDHFWPYDQYKARWNLKPTAASYRYAVRHKSVQYLSLNQDVVTMKSCLAAGFPFVFGFSVYDAFESDVVAQSGILNLPTPSEKNIGGHAVLCVGYDDASQRFIVRNSWGTGWGMSGSGYFTIPYSYLTNVNLADDFWTLRLIAADQPV